MKKIDIKIKLLFSKIEEIWEELDNYNEFLVDIGVVKENYLQWAVKRLGKNEMNTSAKNEAGKSFY